ncbi:MAG TPA: hypothetical protein VFB81_08125 [Myxococcales bacterium]|nr:hypothetical protein [Myxococcales bacterium]
MSAPRLPAGAGLLAAALLAGCYPVPGNTPTGVSSFEVQVNHVYQAGTQRLADVVKACADRHGGSQDSVPEAVRGTLDCPYAITGGAVDFDVFVAAKDARGQEVTGFTAPVAFRAVPGDLALSYQYRWLQMEGGRGRGVMRASHLFAEMRVWVEDAPPEPLFDGGVVMAGAPPEPATRSYATGVSPPIRFEDPTLQKLQNVVPSTFSTLNSPFEQQFVTIGRIAVPDAGVGTPQDFLRQNCPFDPLLAPELRHDGEPVQLVVTGLDCCGFYATDISACVLLEDNSDTGAGFRVQEPNGLYPGRFAAIYVYNYSHPENLEEGDLLWSLSGSVQEFTGTSQITFASWAVRDHVRLRPQEEWNIHLSKVTPYDISMRTCNMNPVPFIEDTLCANSRSSMKMESLESTLVRVRNVKLPDTYVNCDHNDDGTVPFFCSFNPGGGQPRRWGTCPFGDASLDEFPQELQCYINCTNSLAQYTDAVCTEGSAYLNFAQITVELAGPGPAWAGFDETMDGYTQQISVSSFPVRNATALPFNSRARFVCDGPVRYRVGTGTVAANQTDLVQPAGQLWERTLTATDAYISLVNTTANPADPLIGCWVSWNPRIRFLTTLTDAVPGLRLACNPNDADPVAALQCRYLQGARYDITGHLRQVQPARPRWMVIPRDLDDICCRPGPGMQCPTPIQPCP